MVAHYTTHAWAIRDFTERHFAMFHTINYAQNISLPIDDDFLGSSLTG